VRNQIAQLAFLFHGTAFDHLGGADALFGIDVAPADRCGLELAFGSVLARCELRAPKLLELAETAVLAAGVARTRSGVEQLVEDRLWDALRHAVAGEAARASLRPIHEDFVYLARRSAEVGTCGIELDFEALGKTAAGQRRRGFAGSGAGFWFAVGGRAGDRERSQRD
jgi:hypothetical protein